MDYWASRHHSDPELRKQAAKSDWEIELAEAEAAAMKVAAERLSHALGKDVGATPEAVLAATRGEEAQAAPAMDESGMRFGAPRRLTAPDDMEEVFSYKAR